MNEIPVPIANVFGLIAGYVFSGGKVAAGPMFPYPNVPAAKEGEHFWLHFSLADQRCKNWVANNLAVPDAVVQLLFGTDDALKIVHVGEWTCGIVADLAQGFDAETDDSVRLYFAMSGRLLITGRHRPIQSAQKYRERLLHEPPEDRPEAILAQLLLSFVVQVEAIADRLSDELEVIEDKVLDNRFFDESGRLAPLRQLAARQHRLIRSYRRALRRYSKSTSTDTAPHALFISQLPEALEQVDNEFEEIAVRARLLHDEMIAKLAGQTNSSLFVLSALTAVFLPPTLVVGYFGMNFDWMPFIGHPVGVWIGTALCVASSAAVWFFLASLTRR